MFTVQDVARSGLRALDTDAGLLLACKWVQERYRILCSRSRLRHLRKVGQFVVPATISAGTVTTIRGSKAVTGDATAQAAWSSSVVGRWIRPKNAWYEISAYNNTSLTLKTEYAEDDVTAGSYKIVQRFTQLDESVRWLSRNMAHGRTRVPLKSVSQGELDTIAPGRIYAGALAQYWTESQVSINADGHPCKTVELYPYTTNSEVYYFVYWSIPDVLTAEAYIPNEIDPETLKEGVLIDIMRHNAAKAAKPGPDFNIEAAAYWRNEYRQQSTAWEKVLLEAIRNDRGVDDLQMIMDTIGGSYAIGDVTNARDEVYSRGNRP